MNSVVRTSLLLVALLLVVIAGSYFYSRVMRPATAETTPTATGPTTRPELYIGQQLGPEVNAGLQALQENRLEEARASFESVPDTDPGYLIALKHLSEIRIQLGDFPGAREALRELSDLQLDAPEMLRTLAWLEYRLGDFEAAELCALRVLEIEPEDATTRYGVALFRLMQGRLPEAMDTYRRAMEQNTSREQITEALERLLVAHEERPDAPQVHYALAFFAESLGRPEQEIEELRHYLATEPTGPTAELARTRLAEVRAELGE